MKSLIIIISVGLIIFSCSSKPKVVKSGFPNDPKLLTSWQVFKDALNSLDTTLLISLSNPCIICTFCPSDQTSGFMSPQDFYHKEFANVFNSILLSYINDSTKLNADYQNNTFSEEDSCLSINKTPDKPKLANVFVRIPVTIGEGLSVVIHFIEAKSNYEFYGVSTIP